MKNHSTSTDPNTNNINTDKSTDNTNTNTNTNNKNKNDSEPNDKSKDNEYLWYFSFGANMSKDVLSGRREVYPLESKPCRVPNFDLCFNMRGAPYFEPSFASIKEKENSFIHGVIHYITKEDMRQIRLTEGGGGNDNYGYREIEIEVETYNNEKLKAIALQAVKSDIEEALPSARYLNLLVSILSIFVYI
jgi:hypothetical protein